MSLPIIAIRPEPGCSATVAAGNAAGLTIEGWPLFEILPQAWVAPDPSECDALLIGSANAVRQAGPQLSAFAGKPVYAVGAATAKSANEAGLAVAALGKGGLQNLFDQHLQSPVRLLRLAGEEHVPLVLPTGVTMQTRIVYQSAALPMPKELAERLALGAWVLLHSAGAASHFLAECARHLVQRRAISLIALGPRIAEAAGSGWNALHICAQPSEAAMLAMLRGLCHGRDTK